MGEPPRTMLSLRAIVLLLTAQFLLGIWVNLFGTFPRTTSVLSAITYGGDPVLTAHYGLAVVLLLLAIGITVVSFRGTEPPTLRWFALGGLLSIAWAYESGIQFILSGFADNLSSFSMALGFILAMTFYGLAQALVLRAGALSEGAR